MTVTNTLTETQAYNHVDSTNNSTGTMVINRQATNTGGTRGWVSSALRVNTLTAPTSKDFEWGICSVLDNNSAEGENVAVYGQGNRKANGPTWAGVFEARDHTLQSNPQGGLVGIEVDVFANGTDANTRRIGVDLVVGKGVSTGARCEAAVGYRVGPQDGNSSLAYIKRGFQATGEVTDAVFDASQAQVSANGSALKMAVGQKIDFGGIKVSNSPSYGGLLVEGKMGVSGNLEVGGKLHLSTAQSNVTAYNGQSPSGFVDFLIDGVTYKLPFYN